ncbi:hypothetical protein BZL41_08625 [Pseudomonas sp. PIC25]|uniref:hypothetical protein n=1 Tax=Pseudomonas sp. PIC25 TaxID=1958773 RepID=UPI000BAB599F|nr:hypothetical protein [Pseudomonas sp. PIC25]PAU64939.1 hypothetical protein BZL41_08625 [Pseudomonas sp. PIC25]
MPPATPCLLIASGDRDLANRLRQHLAAADLSCDVLAESADCREAPLCRWLRADPAGEPARLRAALMDAVGVLERTRHAFKSRELGELRRRLEALLEASAGRD